MSMLGARCRCSLNPVVFIGWDGGCFFCSLHLPLHLGPRQADCGCGPFLWFAVQKPNLLFLVCYFCFAFCQSWANVVFLCFPVLNLKICGDVFLCVSCLFSFVPSLLVCALFLFRRPAVVSREPARGVAPTP